MVTISHHFGAELQIRCITLPQTHLQMSTYLSRCADTTEGLQQRLHLLDLLRQGRHLAFQSGQPLGVRSRARATSRSSLCPCFRGASLHGDSDERVSGDVVPRRAWYCAVGACIVARLAHEDARVLCGQTRSEIRGGRRPSVSSKTYPGSRCSTNTAGRPAQNRRRT